MKNIALIISILAAASCASNSVSRKPGDALLIGENSSTLKVMIRTIDDGEILWVGNYTLGTRAVVAPGEHKVNVMCEFKFSWGIKMVPGNIQINAQSSTDYKITGRLSSDEKSCNLSASI
ncbi:hypothetical protein AGRI_01830 [Alishewanella agri BL06]|uniref:Lipoprotein n=1 Tax=Alishewanella agri BL06 TaxID=1195246 RepID=I9P6N6_9ALTE|nr:hypothetical protein AGRI_01830 [Alishewanella agri BL06]